MAKYKLGDIVRKVSDRVDKDNCGLTYYIGGEHFDCGEISITKRGVIEESTIGPAFHMRFKPGHVLLMSRNPHLKKAGTVNFEGICSNVSFVLETKDTSVLIQEYLPFLIQTDSFWEFATANKKGSTNYFLNWKDFERYEFELPSIDEQKKLAKILWSAETLKQKYCECVIMAENCVNSELEKIIVSDKNESCLASYCHMVKERYSGEYDDVNALELECFDAGKGELLSVMNSVTGGSTYTAFKKEDVLFGKLRPYLKKYYHANFDGICCNEIWALRANKKCLSRFIYLIISSEIFIKYINSKTFGTKMPRADWKTASQFSLPKLDEKSQEAIVQKLDKYKKSIVQLRKQIEILKNVQATLINGGNADVQ